MSQKRQSLDYNLRSASLTRARETQAQILAKARAARAWQGSGTDALIAYARQHCPVNQRVREIVESPR